MYDSTARYVDQGGNKRPGAFAIYLEPWHADIFEFLDLRKNTGKEEQVCIHGYISHHFLLMYQHYQTYTTIMYLTIITHY